MSLLHHPMYLFFAVWSLFEYQDIVLPVSELSYLYDGNPYTQKDGLYIERGFNTYGITRTH